MDVVVDVIRTIGLDLAVLVLDDFAESWPFGEVLKIEADVVGLSEVVEVARVELEQIHRRHGPNGDHVGDCTDSQEQ